MGVPDDWPVCRRFIVMYPVSLCTQWTLSVYRCTWRLVCLSSFHSYVYTLSAYMYTMNPVCVQVYLTTGLFVVVSWISFIVPPEVVPGIAIHWIVFNLMFFFRPAFLTFVRELLFMVWWCCSWHCLFKVGWRCWSPSSLSWWTSSTLSQPTRPRWDRENGISACAQPTKHCLSAWPCTSSVCAFLQVSCRFFLLHIYNLIKLSLQE